MLGRRREELDEKQREIQDALKTTVKIFHLRKSDIFVDIRVIVKSELPIWINVLPTSKNLNCLSCFRLLDDLKYEILKVKNGYRFYLSIL